MNQEKSDLGEIDPIELYTDSRVNNITEHEKFADELLKIDGGIKNLLDKIKSNEERIKGYNPEHLGTTSKSESDKSFRYEERECIAFVNYFRNCRSQSPVILLDYQLPIKNSNDEKGKAIDLIGEADDTLFLFEYKKLDSNETLLRSVLEIYTYYRLLQNGINQILKEREKIYIVPAILVFKGSNQYENLLELNVTNPIFMIMKELGVEVFVITPDKENIKTDVQLKEMLEKENPEIDFNIVIDKFIFGHSYKMQKEYDKPVYNEMTDSKKYELYKTMWKEKSSFPGKIQRTWWKGNIYSRNSYSFIIPDIDNSKLNKKNIKQISEQLIDIFKISNKEVFVKKLEEVCSGSGDEARKITTLHSSSLCALLHFYNVSENPITLKIEDGIDVIFNDVIFEFQNKVTTRGGPSNIDVTLFGHRISDGKKIILFLESKFSEYYLDATKRLSIRNEYLEYEDFYNEEKLKNCGFSFEKDDNNFTIVSEKTCYLEGFKQMISHFIGVCNFPEQTDLKYLKKIDKWLKEDYEIYLGSVVFTNKISDLTYSNGIKCFDSYRDVYDKFYKLAVNSILMQKHKIHVMKNLISYNDICNGYKNNLEKKILDFYSIT